jgi:sec-independent protein translocase protein TatA
MRIGVTEILLILALALVLFGGGKLAGVGKALGQSIREFKKEVKADEKDESAEQTEDKKTETK